jgi:preprotein translocase subunit SecG
MYTVFVAILILDSLILATAVLLQAGQGGGLATLGGGAGTETIMGGRQATTLLTKVTWWTAGIFLFLSLMLTFMTQSGSQVRSVLQDQQTQQAPAPVQQTPLPIQTQPTAPPGPPAPPANAKTPKPTNRRP